MTTANLYGLDRPDELKDLKLKDANQEEIIEATYSAWWHEGGKVPYGQIDPGKQDELYRYAARMLELFADRFSGRLSQELLELVRETADAKYQDGMRELTGLYLSALHNVTNLTELEVDCDLNGMGWRLKRGKKLVIGKNASMHDLAENMEGGFVINHGQAYNFGTNVSGGVLVNYGEVTSMAFRAKRCLCINYSDKITGMGVDAESGVFLNFGKPGLFEHHRADDGMFIDFAGPRFDSKGSMNIPNWLGRIYIIKPTPESNMSGMVFYEYDMMAGMFEGKDGKGYVRVPQKKDKKLSRLLDRMEKACDALNIPKINTLARKVDEHVRENYERKLMSQWKP